MYDPAKSSLCDITECRAALRKPSAGATSMEEMASRIVRDLYEHPKDTAIGTKACARVRFFKTHPGEPLTKTPKSEKSTPQVSRE